MRAWFACALLLVVAAFEIVFDAPRDLMVATVAAFVLCAALFALSMTRDIDCLAPSDSSNPKSQSACGAGSVAVSQLEHH
jgi:hypothetical protein